MAHDLKILDLSGAVAKENGFQASYFNCETLELPLFYCS